jgi:membrane-associated protease RseP (regulator of RpoE activity)
MLHETASSRDHRPLARPVMAPLSRDEMFQNELRGTISEVMAIDSEAFVAAEPDDERRAAPFAMMGGMPVATFRGRLLLESEAAYAKLDQLLTPTNHTPLFRLAAEVPAAEGSLNLNLASPHVIQIINGRVNPAPRPWWPNALLFIATFFSVAFTGFLLATSTLSEVEANRLFGNLPWELWRGLPYALSLLLILGAHELGHYFAARRHKLAVTLPYFIPLPFVSLIGTMGAFIQLRQPMRNRKVLLDVGAAGPLTGLLFAIPILLIGLSMAQLMQVQTCYPPGTPPELRAYIYEGDSFLYALAKTLIFGRFVPDGVQDVLLSSSQLAWAGWTGLLVTALNLIPIGQLDGGHILYALVGERARRLYYPALIGMFGLTLLSSNWLIWALLLLFLGRVYATPLDTITPLDSRRRWVAVLALLVMVVIFTPAPLATIDLAPCRAPVPGNSVQLDPLLVAALLGRQ